MPSYNVFKTDGSLAAEVADTTINSGDLSISLVGRDFIDYGQIIAETQLHIMENFANTSAPSSPTTGQLWYDTNINVLKVYDGSFTAVTGSSSLVTDLSPELGGQLNANNFKIINVNDPTLAQDAATKNYVDNIISGQLDAGNLTIINVDDPTLAQDAATKNYVDTEILSVSILALNDLVDDTTPQLGGQLDAQNFKIVNVGAPTADSDAATKLYVDSLSAGLDPKESVRVATTGDLGFTFVDNGGVGDTLTAGAPGTTDIDTVTLADGNRVLVKDQTDAKENGIYVASDTAGGLATVLTRATDQDGTPSNEVSSGNFTFVEQGATTDSTGWVVMGDGELAVNTDDIDWTQFSDVGGPTGPIPSGTLMLFQQTAAPTGWTKQVAHNNKALRVVSGTASDAGTTPFTTIFGAGKITGSHILTIAEMPSHTHAQDVLTRSKLNDGTQEAPTGSLTDSDGGTTQATGGGGSHNHTLSLDLQYVDLIIASKD